MKEAMKDYKPREFWNKRFRIYGHTGDVDSLIYAYDQPQRLRAIDKALSYSGVRINKDTKILDVGCGTGDMISLFISKGGIDITGIDIADEVINYARKRFTHEKRVKFLVMKLEDLGFAPNSFDLVLSVNVLQHVFNEEAFFKAIENMTEVTKTGGHILTMDFSPVKVRVRKPTFYTIVRPRKKYVQAFERKRGKLVCEFGLPRIGVRFCRVISQGLIKFIKSCFNLKKILMRKRL